ncbi:hypothetical protein J7E79_23080 [Bacillus sp. ISL-40]|uniref:hypothetical protein n=1 Tax=Bacillus sp. ISL-40 TaxID=2819126 RepID=UPI001BE5A476|nr:hypothetical protein [Bacillus sp. ISL-40]MBT2700253.1 hypothetical protein [Bacillus sp. ISL-40]
MLEKIYPQLLSILVTVYLYFTEFKLGALQNYKDIMSASISLGSIAVGFLAAAITLMPSMDNNELVRNLRRMGAYKKLLKYIITAIFSLFSTCFLSLIALFTDSKTNSIFNVIFNNAWILVFIFSLLATFRVIQTFLKFLVLSQQDDDHI